MGGFFGGNCKSFVSLIFGIFGSGSGFLSSLKSSKSGRSSVKSSAISTSKSFGGGV